MKRHWFILFSIAIVILLFRVKWDVKKIYVKDNGIKEMVEKILIEKHYRFSFVDNEENALVIEKDRMILPPNDIVLHLDWSEEKKEKAKRLAESLFQEGVVLSATETKIATEDVILERALDSFSEEIVLSSRTDITVETSICFSKMSVLQGTIQKQRNLSFLVLRR